MARVDETPTYENQSSFSLMVHAARIRDQSFIDRYCSLLKNFATINDDNYAEYFHMARSGYTSPILSGDRMRLNNASALAWRDAAYSAGLRKDRNPRKSYLLSERVINSIKGILDYYKIDAIYSDHDARHYLLCELITKPELTVYKTERIDRVAHELTQMIFLTTAPYLKIGAGGVEYVNKNITLNPSGKREIRHAFAVANATEKMIMSSSCNQFRIAHSDTSQSFVKLDTQPPHEWFGIGESAAAACFRGIYWFRFFSIWVAVYKETMFVLDRASIDQLRLRGWSFYMFTSYYLNYRLTLRDEKASEKFKKLAQAGLSWYTNCVRYARKNGLNVSALARSMKIGQSRFLNRAWDQGEVIVDDRDSRDIAFLQDEQQWFKAPQPWSDWLIARREWYTDSTLLDMSYLFHIAPGTDANVAQLFIDTLDRLNSERPNDPAEVKRFLNYCHATLVMEFVAREAHRGTEEAEILKGLESDIPLNGNHAEWLDRCLHGKRHLPPEEDWGKVRLVNALPYHLKMEFAWLDAHDVTHVNSSRDDLFDERKAWVESCVDNNELLYSIKYGARLSKHYDPSKWRSELCKGHVLGEIFSVIAAKAENTKLGSKIRETYSAVDTFREMQSEIDQNFQVIASMIRGPALRSSSMSINHLMHTIATGMITPPGSLFYNIVTSQDVASWSPRMSRKFAISFYNLLLRTMKIPAGLDMQTLWSSIGVAVNKRGVKGFEYTTTGNFMGWPGTADTIMHSLICAYAVNRAKHAGMMLQTETATIVTMIDDAIISLRLMNDETDSQSKVTKFMSFLCNVYESLGFEIDFVKTIVSSTKFTFLNRVFAHGVEALTPMKIYMKANREIRLQLSNIFDQASSVFNSLYGATERGADPTVGYMVAVYHASRIMLMTSKRLTKHPIPLAVQSLIALAPRSLGGWGFPNLISWLTKEASDPLSEWFGICASYIKLMDESASTAHELTHTAAVCASSFRRLASRIINVPLTKPPCDAFISAPRVVHALGIRDPSTMTRGLLLSKARRLARSAETKAVLEAESSEFFEASFNDILTNSVLDIAIIEMFGEILPMSFMAGIMAKATRNEIVLMLIGQNERSILRRRIQRAERSNLNFLIDLWLGESNGPEHSLTLTGAHYASLMRERMYDMMGMKFVNHTEPAIMDLLVHVETSTRDDQYRYAVVSYEPPITILQKHQFAANLFDGKTPGKYNPGIRTRGSFNIEAPGLRTHSAVTRLFVRLVATCRWMSGVGINPDPFWKLGSASWVPDITTSWQELSVDIPPDVSSKRLARAVANVSHPIGAYPNTQGCVLVDLSAFDRLLEQGNHRYDYVSLVQSMRASALIDVSCSATTFDYRNYGLNPMALVPTVYDGMIVRTTRVFDDNISKLRPVFEKVAFVVKCVKETCLSLEIHACDPAMEVESETWEHLIADTALTHATSYKIHSELDWDTMLKLIQSEGVDAPHTSLMSQLKDLIKGSDWDSKIKSFYAYPTTSTQTPAIWQIIETNWGSIRCAVEAAVLSLPRIRVELTSPHSLSESYAKQVLGECISTQQIHNAITMVRRMIRHKRLSPSYVSDIIRFFFGTPGYNSLLSTTRSDEWQTVYLMILYYQSRRSTALRPFAVSQQQVTRQRIGSLIDQNRTNAQKAWVDHNYHVWCRENVQMSIRHAALVFNPSTSDVRTIAQSWAYGVASAIRDISAALHCGKFNFNEAMRCAPITGTSSDRMNWLQELVGQLNSDYVQTIINAAIDEHSSLMSSYEPAVRTADASTSTSDLIRNIQIGAPATTHEDYSSQPGPSKRPEGAWTIPTVQPRSDVLSMFPYRVRVAAMFKLGLISKPQDYSGMSYYHDILADKVDISRYAEQVSKIKTDNPLLLEEMHLAMMIYEARTQSNITDT